MDWPAIVALVVMVMVLIAVILAALGLTKALTKEKTPTGTISTPSGKGSMSGREVLLWSILSPPVALFSLWLSLAMLRGCIIPLATMPTSTPGPKAEEENKSPPPNPWSDLEPAVPTPTSVVTPVSTSAPPVDYRQEWIRLMGQQIDELVQAQAVLVEDIQPVSTVTLVPGEVRFAGQVLDSDTGRHAWLTTSGDRKKIECCGSVHQNKWFSLDANPCRVFSEPGDDAILLRLKPGGSPLTVTAEQVVKNGQRHRTDTATLPAVRKICRNVPGQKGVALQYVLTRLPSGQRVDSKVLVLLTRSQGAAIAPSDPVSRFTVDFGSGSKFQALKFEDTTLGKDNPPLTVVPVKAGVYDIVVVITPL